MANVIPLQEVSGVASYIEVVLDRCADWRARARSGSKVLKDTGIWFRGHSRTSHTLVPSAYRGDWDHLSMYNRFVAAGAGVLTPTPVGAWAWYFTAQHYELPTRLLDWTEDPLAALYFAVRGMLADDAALDVDPTDPPLVWMMDACALNYLSYGCDEVIVPHDDAEFSDHWKPGVISAAPKSFIFDEVAYTNEKPIAIWPTRTTPRIMAQNGCFTVHGTSKMPLETVFEQGSGPAVDLMLKIQVVEPERIDRELSDLSISRVRLFPELHNVASRLRRVYKTV